MQQITNNNQQHLDSIYAEYLILVGDTPTYKEMRAAEKKLESQYGLIDTYNALHTTYSV